MVLPTAYGRDGDTVYLHGSSANGAFRAATGQPGVHDRHPSGRAGRGPLGVQPLDELPERGRLRHRDLVTGEDERWHGLQVVTDHLIPGRWAAARQPTKKEMAATAVLSLPLAEASVKVRTGRPATSPRTWPSTCGRACCRSPSASARRSRTPTWARTSRSRPTSATGSADRDRLTGSGSGSPVLQCCSYRAGSGSLSSGCLLALRRPAVPQIEVRPFHRA